MCKNLLVMKTNHTVADYLAWISTQDMSSHGITSISFKLPADAFDFANGAQWLSVEAVRAHVASFPAAGGVRCLRLDMRDVGGNEIRLDLNYKGGSLSMSRKEDRANGFFESYASLSELPLWGDLVAGTSKFKFYTNGNPVMA